MTGNTEDTSVPGGAPGKPKKGRVQALACSRCGAALTIRNPGASMSVACDSCGGVLDLTDKNLQRISQFYSKVKEEPLIPLGTRGVLFGRKWEVIGFLVRSDVGSGFHWREYLLFNPYYGYRWLAFDRGHWTFVTTLRDRPRISNDYMPSSLRMQGTAYKLFYSGQARIEYVHGEFYWRVIVDSTVTMSDYIAPPLVLSCEKDEEEINWSRGEYVPHEVIEKAFGVTLPDPIRIVPNQPNPFASGQKQIVFLWILFSTVLFAAQIVHMITASNRIVYSNTFVIPANQKVPDQTTVAFKLEKPMANVQIDVSAPVNNSWLYVAGDLVSDTSGTTYGFEQSVEYYHGIDGGEAWSEGSGAASTLVSTVPEGQYYLNLDFETGSFTSGQPVSVIVVVKRDVTTYSNCFYGLLFLALLPCFRLWKSNGFEVSRWSESDYSPYASKEE